MNQDDFRKLISGQKAGSGATLLRFLLRAASVGYSLAICLRNFLYSVRWLKIYSADAVVISIGNITTGGTGKTPLVIWLCNQIISDYQCTILTRGYKTGAQEAEQFTDEPAIYAESCPEVKVIVNPDRVAGAEEAAIKFGTKVLIMDDGFQHRRLARNLDIVAVYIYPRRLCLSSKLRHQHMDESSMNQVNWVNVRNVLDLPRYIVRLNRNGKHPFYLLW